MRKLNKILKLIASFINSPVRLIFIFCSVLGQGVIAQEGGSKSKYRVIAVQNGGSHIKSVSNEVIAIVASKYYFPNACLTKQCQFQLTIHGCGGEADDIAVVFGNYAAANDIVMVFPQATGCYMGDAEGDEEMEWNQVARDGSMMTFMKGIFDRVTDTDTSSL